MISGHSVGHQKSAQKCDCLIKRQGVARRGNREIPRKLEQGLRDARFFTS